MGQDRVRKVFQVSVGFVIALYLLRPSSFQKLSGHQVEALLILKYYPRVLRRSRPKGGLISVNNNYSTHHSLISIHVSA